MKKFLMIVAFLSFACNGAFALQARIEFKQQERSPFRTTVWNSRESINKFMLSRDQVRQIENIREAYKKEYESISADIAAHNDTLVDLMRESADEEKTIKQL